MRVATVNEKQPALRTTELRLSPLTIPQINLERAEVSRREIHYTSHATRGVIDEINNKKQDIINAEYRVRPIIVFFFRFLRKAIQLLSFPAPIIIFINAMLAGSLVMEFNVMIASGTLQAVAHFLGIVLSSAAFMTTSLAIVLLPVLLFQIVKYLWRRMSIEEKVRGNTTRYRY